MCLRAVARAIQLSSCGASNSMSNPCDAPPSQQRAAPAAPQLIGVSSYSSLHDVCDFGMKALKLQQPSRIGVSQRHANELQCQAHLLPGNSLVLRLSVGKIADKST